MAGTSGQARAVGKIDALCQREIGAPIPSPAQRKAWPHHSVSWTRPPLAAKPHATLKRAALKRTRQRLIGIGGQRLALVQTPSHVRGQRAIGPRAVNDSGWPRDAAR